MSAHTTDRVTGDRHVLVRARDGSLVLVRPLNRGEHEVVQAVFDGMSAESRRLRFLAPMPRLSATMVRRLADVDHHRHGAWVAVVDGAPVAIARFVAFTDCPRLADVAVSVVDCWQGRGLGRVLLEVLGVAAADVGVSRFSWTMEEGNQRIRRLAAQFPGGQTVEDGVVEARTALPRGVGVDVDAIRRLSAEARRRAAADRAA
jgi:GNAT superfamily N-acetyltransferase